MAAVKLTKTSIRLLEQPESMRSIVGAFGGEKKTVETAMLFLLSGALLSPHRILALQASDA